MSEQDFAWLVDHNAELVGTYPGKWVAVRDGKVVGVGETAVEAAENAGKQVSDRQFILEAIEPSANVIYCGA